MTQDLHMSSFMMMVFSLMLYFSMGHAKVSGHVSTPEPTPSGKKYLSWRKWVWPWP